MSKNILITGANGVLAKKLIEKFAECPDYTVFASSRNPEMIQFKISGVEYIANQALITTNLLERIDIVINTAFPRTQEIKEMYDATEFFIYLVKCSIQHNVKQFINISSQMLYGENRERPSLETDSLNPPDLYSLTKYSTENIGNALTQNTNLKYTNIRLASLIGIEYPERCINKMIDSGIKKKKITVQNAQSNLGYMDISDAVDGLYTFVSNSNADNWKPAYNLGARPNFKGTLKNIAIMIRDIAKEYNVNIEINIDEEQNNTKLRKMDSRAFYKISNWKPKIPLEKSIWEIFEDKLAEHLSNSGK